MDACSHTGYKTFVINKWVLVHLYPISFVPPGKGNSYVQVFYSLMKHIFITLGYKIDWNLIKSWSLIWNTHKVICHWKKRGEGAASGTFTQWGIWFVHFMFLLCCLKNFFKIYSNVILCNHWSSVDWVSPESRCRIYVNNLQLIPSVANAKNGHSK